MIDDIKNFSTNKFEEEHSINIKLYGVFFPSCSKMLFCDKFKESQTDT